MADQSPRIRKNPLTKANTNFVPQGTSTTTAIATESLLIAKAAKETALAEQVELDLALAKKHLLIRGDVEKTLFEESRNLRDRLHSMCTKLAPKISKTTKPEEIKKLLKENINNVLRDYTEELNQKL